MTRKNIKNRINRTLAVAMSTMLVMSSSSINVMAASIASDSNAAQITETTGNGSIENPTTTQTTTSVTDPETKQTTTTIDVTISGTGTDANGATVNLNVTKGSVTVTNEENDILKASGNESGTETTTETSTSATTDTTASAPSSSTTTVPGSTTTTTTTGTPTEIDNNPTTTDSQQIPLGTDNISVTVTPGTTVSNPADADTAKSELASGLANELLTIPESSTTTDYDEETGITTTTVVSVNRLTDDNGNTFGYTTTTTVTTTASDTDVQTEQLGDSIVETVTGETTTETTTNTEIVLPEKPLAGELVDETTGNRTTTTVEELLDADGNVVGYQSTTLITDANGKVLNTLKDSVWGTKTTTTTTNTTPSTTTTTTNNKVTTTTTSVITEAKTVSGEKIIATPRQITATMTEITTNGTHGSVDTNSLKPNLTSTGPQAQKNGETNTATDLYNPYTSDTITDLEGYDFLYKGASGLESAIRVNQNGDDSSIVRQFILYDKNNEEHYVFCADLGTYTVDGYRYNMENVEDAEYYSDEEAKIITNVALNGYWGTDSGVGSLSALQENLTKALEEAVKAGKGDEFPLTAEQIKNLTPGQALTATQAAIWYYGNCDKDLYGMPDPTTENLNVAGRYNTDGSLGDSSTEDINAVNGLYQYLLQLPTTGSDTTTEFIDAPDFAQEATIIVGQLAADKDGNLLAANTDNDNTNDVYDTDINFSLSIVPDEKDNLIVTVYDKNNTPISIKRLAGDDSATNYGTITRNPDGTYTIEDLQISETDFITLNLSGTQHLYHGVYLYSSEVRYSDVNDTEGTTAQTFVGIAEGTRDVDLNVSLNFSVNEPTAKLESTSSGSTTQRTDVTTESRIDTTTESQITATIVVTATEKTETNHSWENSWSYEAPTETPTTPGTPGTPSTPSEPEYPATPARYEEPETPIEPEVLGAEDEPAIVIEDNEIPLGVLGASDDLRAVAPATGDASGLWAVLTAISGFLLSGFCFIDKKRKTTR